MADKKRLVRTALRHVSSEDRGLARCLAERRFVPFFQPVVTLRTGQLAGFEVLARCQHPAYGLIPPDRFIARAEREGWINALSRQIFTGAFDAASSIPAPLTLAINISPVQLRDLSLPGHIKAMAEEAGFSLSRLIVEITESALIDNMQVAGSILAELKAMGCRLALDDFGTGYSSLHHLQSLPFDILKVDRSFVSSMTEKRQSRKIVSAVVGLGHSLGLTTVAEGIETQEQAEMMLWLGCELGQGYFYDRPIPSEGLAAAASVRRERTMSSNQSAWKRISAADIDVSPSQRLAQLQALYDGAPVGLAFVDQNLRYLNLNQKLADMNGAPVERHLGSHISEMIPELFPYVEPYIRRALKGEATMDVEAQLPDADTTCLYSCQPALDEAGEVVGVAIAVTDITDRKRTADALKVSEAHYRRMVELNPQVLWIMDPQGRNLDVSPRWDKNTGLMKLQSADHAWLKAVHPADLEATVRAIADFRRSGSPIVVEYRVAVGEGDWQWKRSRGSPRFDAGGNIVCWYGSVEDIDDPGQTKELRSTPVRPEEVSAEGMLEPITSEQTTEGKRCQALLDLEIMDTPAEAEFDDLVALASEICAAPISLVSLLDSRRQWFKASIGIDAGEAHIESAICAHAIEQQGIFTVKDTALDERFSGNPLVLGDPYIRFYAGMPLYAGEGVAVGTLCVMDTVPRTLSPSQIKAIAILGQQVQTRMELRSERRKFLRVIEKNRELTTQLETINRALVESNSQLKQAAITDALTGLLNRRAFEARIAVEFANARRKLRTLSLLVMDIDDFKMRNDEFGHAAGDEALRHLGEVLRNVLRSSDSAARIGGEEFAVVLPETTPDQAGHLAKRIQELVAAGGAGFPRITLSIGIARLHENTTDWIALLSQADLAMYNAKRTGKNRFSIYDTTHAA